MMQLGIPMLAVIVLTCGVRADSVDINLTQTTQIAAPGSTITFDATITNQSSTDTVYLNGDSSVTSSTLLSIDDTPFLTNFPLWLDPSESSGPFALFNVLIDPSTPAGIYDLNSFSILGGLDGSTFDVTGTATFAVDVTKMATTAEPPMWLLMLISLVGIGCAQEALSKRCSIRRRCITPTGYSSWHSSFVPSKSGEAEETSADARCSWL